MKLGSLVLPLFVAGILSAQPAAHNRPSMMQRLTANLNLTADQQTQAKAIFQGARQQSHSIAPQLQQQRQAMSAAIKSDNEGQIDQLTQQNAQLSAQARAIHAKAMAKFYSILTPDQKAKFDQRMNRMSARGARMGQRSASRQG
jgi:Spy/CpxP family protein refolding chaperone